MMASYAINIREGSAKNHRRLMPEIIKPARARKLKSSSAGLTVLSSHKQIEY